MSLGLSFLFNEELRHLGFYLVLLFSLGLYMHLYLENPLEGLAVSLNL